MGRVSSRVADQAKGGFLDDVDFEIVGAKYVRGSFEGDDGTTVHKTQAILDLQIEGREDPIPVFLSIGNADILCPYEDEDCTVEADEGQYLGVKEGKESRGVSQDSKWGKFCAALVTKCKFPDSLLDGSIPLEAALVGVRGHMTSLPGGKFQGKVGRPVPVPASIEKDSIPTKGGAKAGKSSKPAAGGLGKLKSKAKAKPEPEEVEDDDTEVEETPAPKAKATKLSAKKKPEPEPEPEETEEGSLEETVGEAIIKAVAKAPLAKGALAQRVGKVFEGEDNRAEAVQLAMSDKFLKAGAGEGLWSYDGRMVSSTDAE